MAQKPAINLEEMSAEELKALMASAEVKFHEKQGEALAALKAEIEEKAAALGTSVAELFGLQSPPAPALRRSPSHPAGRKPRKDAGTPLPAKYRTPEGNEWTGRGRKPNWLAAMEAEGKDIEQFKVLSEAA